MQEKATSGGLGAVARPQALREGGSARRIGSEELFRGAEEIVIEHGGFRYLLRRSTPGGLVLIFLE